MFIGGAKDTSMLSGGGQVSVPEIYIPLWWYSGAYFSIAATLTGSTEVRFVGKGSTSMVNPKTSACDLLRFDSIPDGTQFAFEASLSTNNGSGLATAKLWNFTDGVEVSGSLISLGVGITTITTLRSGKFDLLPNKVYGIVVTTNTASYTTRMTDASLIVFPS